MGDKTVTILDHVDDIEVPGNVFNEPANEYWALVSLHQGMEFLYRQATEYDEVARRAMNPSGKSRVFAFGNVPEFSKIPQGLLTCAFHWYAISACQYVRTVGAIAYRQDQARPKPLDYLNKIIPEVSVFRDKIAAHYAWNTKNQKDNEAERLASIMPPLVFQDDSFVVGGYTVSVSRHGVASDSSNIKPWSIRNTHEQLERRYCLDSPEDTVATD